MILAVFSFGVNNVTWPDCPHKNFYFYCGLQLKVRYK